MDKQLNVLKFLVADKHVDVATMVDLVTLVTKNITGTKDADARREFLNKLYNTIPSELASFCSET